MKWRMRDTWKYQIPVPEFGVIVGLDPHIDSLRVVVHPTNRHDSINPSVNAAGMDIWHDVPWDSLQRPKSKIEIADELVNRVEAALKGKHDPNLGDLIEAYRAAEE